MRLHEEVVALLRQPLIREKLLAEGAGPVGNTPEQFRAFIEAGIAKWGKIIRAAGLTTSTLRPLTARVTGIRSRIGSNGSVLNNAGAIAMPPT